MTCKELTNIVQPTGAVFTAKVSSHVRIFKPAQCPIWHGDFEYCWVKKTKLHIWVGAEAALNCAECISLLGNGGCIVREYRNPVAFVEKRGRGFPRIRQNPAPDMEEVYPCNKGTRWVPLLGLLLHGGSSRGFSFRPSKSWSSWVIKSVARGPFRPSGTPIT